jgi:hypothetical protein
MSRPQTYKCGKKHTGTVVDESTPISFYHHSNEPGSLAMSTYSKNFNLEGAPIYIVLSHVYAAHVGQIWVNGTKIWSTPNHRFGDTDWRNGSVVTLSPTYNENGLLISWGGRYLRLASGQLIYFIHADNMDHSFNPNVNVTSLLHVGDNTIDIVCIGAPLGGSCDITFLGNFNQKVFKKELVNECTEFEQRAGI